MRYTQPKITRSNSAVLAIQSVGLLDSQKPDFIVADQAPGTKPTTNAAYEADE